MSVPSRNVGLVIFESSTSAFLVLSAFLGNSLLLAALYKKPRLKSSTVLFIAALAVTDLLNACIPGLFFVSSLTTGKSPFGKFGCHISGFFLHFLTYASMSTMTLTAINRFFCVLKPRVYKYAFTYQRSSIYIASLWMFVAVVVIIPIAAEWSSFSFNPMMASCAMKFAKPEVEFGYTTFIVAFFVVVCFAITTFCYFSVSRGIRQHNASVIASLTAQEIRLTRALFVLVFTFAALWIPTFFVIVLMRLVFRASVPREVSLLVPYLMRLSSALNPWIYGVMSPAVRDKMNKSLCKSNSVTVLCEPINETIVVRRCLGSRTENSTRNTFHQELTLYNGPPSTHVWWFTMGSHSIREKPSRFFSLPQLPPTKKSPKNDLTAFFSFHASRLHPKLNLLMFDLVLISRRCMNHIPSLDSIQ